MKTKKICSLVLCAVILPLGQFAFSQGALEAQKELAGPRKVEQVFKDDGAELKDLSKNPIEETKPSPPIYESGPAATLAPPIDPYKAEGGPLRLLNCGGSGISVKTYNSNDGVMWVPFQEVGIAAGKSSGLKCATSSCKLQIGGLKTGAVSGAQVYVGGRVRATNTVAMSAGCKSYN